MNTEIDHAWTREQMATALADGLTGDDRARFDAHLATCAECAQSFADMQRREADLVALFADARPASGFEDRLIRNLRQTKPRRTWVHPMVRHAATGVAAALVLASAGYVVTSASNGGTLPDLVAVANRVKSASSLKDIGNAVMLYSNENRDGGNQQAADYEVFTAPSSNAEWDRAATTRPGARNFRDLAQNLSYSYQHPDPNALGGTAKNHWYREPQFGSQPGASSLGSGLQINGGVTGGFAVGRGTDTGAGEAEVARRLGGKNVGKDDEKKVPYDEVLRHPTNWPDRPAVRFDAEAKPAQAAKSADHDMDDKHGARVYFQDGNVEAGDATTALPSVNGTGDQSNRISLGVPAQRLEEGKPGAADPALGRASTPALAFKPADLAALMPADGSKYSGGTIEQLHQKVDELKDVALQGGTQGGQPQGKPTDAPIAGSVIVSDLVQSVRPPIAQAGQEQPAPAPQTPPQAQQPPQAAPSRKVIRTGVMEFEVDRYDAALAMITKLTQENGGYIGTTDSEKLPNGKVKGTVTVRVPPDRLDTLVMQLRGIGDLRSQKMDAQDVTKQYTDLEGELRAARAMEERLLEIIKTGKGEIKDLLAAEKELGVWRTKIEKMVGEMRYYDNLVSLTTLTITAFERDIRTAATSKETETVQAGIETDDVETARAAALKAIDEAKGRVIQSDLKRHDAGQFSAQVVADVAPDAAGPLVDRLKQLGKVARFEVQRKQTTPEGTTQPAPGARLERADTRINLSLYNLANVAPRQTTNLNLAAADVESAYKAIAARVEKAGGRVVTSNLSRPQADQVVGSISFEVKSADAEPVLGDVRALGEVMRLTVTENPDTNNVTTAKQGFVVQLASVAAVPARESTNLQIAAADVPTAYNALREAVRATPARVTTSQLNEAVRENVTAIIDFEVMRADLAAVEEVLKKLGDVTQRTSGRSGDTENTVDSKVRMQVSFVDADQLPPRETTALGIETSDPDKALADLQSFATGAGGRVIQSDLSQERGGQTIGKLVVDVPLAKSVELITRAKGQGSVRMVQSTKDAQVPDGSLARARVDMTFATSASIVSADQGVWASIRRGLAASMTGLMWSLQLIIIGLCFVGPWVLLILLGWKLLRRKKAAPEPVPA